MCTVQHHPQSKLCLSHHHTHSTSNKAHATMTTDVLTPITNCPAFIRVSQKKERPIQVARGHTLHTHHSYLPPLRYRIKERVKERTKTSLLSPSK